MNKNYVYIDFEAIANPFARIINLPSDTPYAYTVGGLNKYQNFETKTFIVDFNKGNNLNNIWSIIKQNIIKHIYEINPKLKISEIVFIGHNPNLEKRILQKLFPNNEVQPLLDPSCPVLSLSKLTGPIFEDEYFLNIKKAIKDSGIESLKKRVAGKNGAIASFVGHWLYINAIKNLRVNDKRKKYFLKLNKNLVIKELRKYSGDDVKKMLFLTTDQERTDKMIKQYLYKKELLKQIKNLELDENLTIKDIKQKIWNL
ncbi:DUF2779 domain-containing protein [Metamycoplasma phocicerebrale]|uniref:DUF2779 domain-containing protein n=1 Tax=Metamycoplasma phocicerebrale TaxID=142649 RepID=A0A3Q9V581_9BACT|nr:DUF2779 domain-containing protein [Metamycoplasma phocicerebrale]AZZ65361.1 DUF2779 domain-containing protein [Metamycoplasma phocicerebrale]